LFAIVMVFATSIPMARVLGPERLGYFNFVALIANISTLLAIGIPGITHKFMAEYLGSGQQGRARTVFYETLWLQVLAAALITAVAETIAMRSVDPAHRVVSMVQILSTLPAMLTAVPSQANNAFEDMRANVAGSIVSSVLYLIGVVASLLLHWDLLGVAIAFTVSRSVEFVVRVVPVMIRLRGFTPVPIDPVARPSMRNYALQCVGLLLLNAIVWDRSDVVMLKWLSHDLRQITFFTIAFNITEKTVLLPQVFGHAMGVTMMVEYGRQRERVGHLATAAARYIFLIAAPMAFGLAMLSGPIIRVLYGPQYLPVIPILALASALGVVKPLLLPAQYYLRAHTRQGPLLINNGICGAANFAIDGALIPFLGALGATIGNGTAQGLAVIGIWTYGIRRFGMRMDFAAVLKISVASAAMAPPVLLLNAFLPPVFALIAAVPAGAAAFLLMLRPLRVLQPEDAGRLNQIAKSLPGPVRGIFDRMVAFLIVPAMATA
jgi:O-antigen/teichoic acid export membrane protein